MQSTAAVVSQVIQLHSFPLLPLFKNRLLFAMGFSTTVRQRKGSEMAHVITIIIWIRNFVAEERTDADLGTEGMKSGFAPPCLCERLYQTQSRLEEQFQVHNRVSDTEPDNWEGLQDILKIRKAMLRKGDNHGTNWMLVKKLKLAH